MKRYVSLSIIVTLLILAGATAAAAALPAFQSARPVASFEGGSLYFSGRVPVLNLHGAYRQMGRQYGHLVKDQLKELYRIAIDEYCIGEKGLSLKTLKSTAMGLFAYYPQRFKDIVYGMAETSGLSLEQHIVLNGIELYGSLPGCSAIAAWRDYAEGGTLVFGRNYDWYKRYEDFAKYLTVTVFNAEGSIPTAIVTFTGVIYATTGMNAQGLFLELNNGFPSGGGLYHSNRVHAVANPLAFLFDCSTMDHLDAAFNSTRSNFAFIINVADSNGAWSYEWPPFDIRKRTGEDKGLLVSTNHFVDAAWGIVLQQNEGFKSALRRKHLLSLGNTHKGRISCTAMMELLDIPIDKGGATWPAEDAIQTVYQVIAVPMDLKLWIKVPGFQNWTGVDLSALFKKTKNGVMN